MAWAKMASTYVSTWQRTQHHHSWLRSSSLGSCGGSMACLCRSHEPRQENSPLWSPPFSSRQHPCVRDQKCGPNQGTEQTFRKQRVKNGWKMKNVSERRLKGKCDTHMCGLVGAEKQKCWKYVVFKAFLRGQGSKKHSRKTNGFQRMARFGSFRRRKSVTFH